ncbi:MAG TPA: phosphopentomutase [Clostridia bacterium]|nr:phosphopentomutase [Clostridia bacterium]
MKKRAIVLILDSLGVGYMEDVLKVRPQDEGANTFLHILDKAPEIHIPRLEWLGIGSILKHPRLAAVSPASSYGVLQLQHDGADSYAGHQEIMGTKPKKPVTEPFKNHLEKVKAALESEGYNAEIPDPDRQFLLVDGLVVIADNIETDYGQIYNVTAPLDHISFDEVLRIAGIVRKLVKVNRVIALGGENVSPEHILNCIEVRKDGLVGVNSPRSQVYKQRYQCRHMGYGIETDKQISSILVSEGKEVCLIGKMQDVIQCEGAKGIPAVDTELVMKELIKSMDWVREGLIAATVQETDLAGHSEDVERYALKIMTVDRYLEAIIDKMTEEDILIISADHGNDPTIGHSQHTREKTFLLVYGKKLISTRLGERETLSDIAATVADFFQVRKPENGSSFYGSLAEIKKG